MKQLKNLLKNKFGQAGGIVPIMASVLGIGIVLMILGIMLSYQADVVADIGDDLYSEASDTATYAYNITQDNLETTNDLAGRQDTLVGISIAVVIIALLLVAASIVGIRIAG